MTPQPLGEHAAQIIATWSPELMSPDLVNGLFEFFGSVMLWRNVLQLYRDKHVAGVHWSATGFFMAWGYWNLFYYPHLHQWWSFAGGVSIVTANTVWLLQMFYYGRTVPA